MTGMSQVVTPFWVPCRQSHELIGEERELKFRPEQEVFDELAKLCASAGYAHAIAYFCFRDQVVGYGDELKGEDYAKLFSIDRLIRTEISTVIGLMLRAPRDLTIPDPKQLQEYIERTEALLKEMHHAMNAPAMEILKAAMADPTRAQGVDPFANADSMREPIFYGAESAYSFQYRDLAVQKYAYDNEWLLKNKGFTSEDGKKVVSAISDFLNEKVLTTLKGLKGLPPEQWTILAGFSFSMTDIATKSGLAAEVVNAVIAAFSFPEDGNPTFTSLHAFNSANAFPIFKGDGDDYILFLYVSLTEALYDTPFYWMTADKAYLATAMAHRGQFTERFASERLERVFGVA